MSFLLAALGVLLAAEAGADDCVKIGRPKLGVKYAFHFTDGAGTVSTSTTEYLAVSDTSVRLRLTHTGAFGTVERVNDSTLRVEDDLVVVEKMVSSARTNGVRSRTRSRSSRAGSAIPRPGPAAAARGQSRRWPCPRWDHRVGRRRRPRTEAAAG